MTTTQLRTHSLNSASANTGEGCPRQFGSKAPDTIVRDIVRGRVVISRMGARTLLGIIKKMADRIRELEAGERVRVAGKFEPRRQAQHD